MTTSPITVGQSIFCPTAEMNATALTKAREIANGKPVRELHWFEIQTAGDMSRYGAAVINLGDGYAVHRISRGACGAIVWRVYAEGGRK